MTGSPGEQLEELLRGRAGWRLEALATPGSPPSWCFFVDKRIELSLLVGAGGLELYVTADDEDVDLESVEALVSWLGMHKPEALGPRRAGVLDRLRRGGIFSWD